MPVNWNSANDQLLLLKLIETHAININYQKIVDAWPKNAPCVPTTRAISERFAKIKKLVGGGGSGTAARVTATPRSRNVGLKTTTPASSARKRKAKQASDSEDAEDHVTADENDESPLKKQQTLKNASGVRRNAGGAHGMMNSGMGQDGAGVGSGMGVNIKAEPTDDPFVDGSFARGLAQAERLTTSLNYTTNQAHPILHSPMANDFGFGTPAGIPSPAFNPGPAMSSFNSSFDDTFGMDGTTDITMASMNPMMLNNAGNGVPGTPASPMPQRMSFPQPSAMRGLSRPGMSSSHSNISGPMSPRFLDAAAGMRITPQPDAHASGLGTNTRRTNTPYRETIATKSVAAYRSNAPRAAAQAISCVSRASPAPRPSIAPSEASISTIAASRPKRQASKQAAEAFHEFVKIEKAMAREDGERSSVEDSAESQFEASDEDFA